MKSLIAIENRDQRGQGGEKGSCATVDNDCNHNAIDNAIDIYDDLYNVVDVTEAVGLVLTLYCLQTVDNTGVLAAVWDNKPTF